MKHLVLLVLVVACGSKSSDKPKGGSPDWGDDPRPLGACIGTAQPGAALPAGAPTTTCLENQTEDECTRPSSAPFAWTFAYHTTCKSKGYVLACAGGDYPASARFQKCPDNARDAAPPSPQLAAGKQMVAVLDQAIAAFDATKPDCAALGVQLAPLRDKLWDLGKANPGALKSLSNGELKSLKIADRFESLTAKLPTCKDDVHAKEFAYAMGKLL